MTERMMRLKERVVAEEPALCPERARIITDSFRSTEGMPQVLRRAAAFRDILERMTIFIDRDELIVGNHASAPNRTPLFPEFSISFLVDELDSIADRPYDRFLLDEETRKTIEEIAPYWRGKTHEDLVVSTTAAVLPEEVRPAWEEGPFRLNDVLYDGVRKSAGDGHIIPDYPRLLRNGIPGVIHEAKEALGRLDMSGDVDAFRKKLFLEAVLISCRAVAGWIGRYASMAASLAEQAEDQEERSRLEVVAETCSRLTKQAPESFHEALQLCFFLHLLIQIESNGHSVSFGCLDRYLDGFYRRDLEGGTISRERALELIDCLYIKTSRMNKLRPWPETRLKSGAPMFMTITLGGQTAEGSDATNGLTWLFLESLADTRLPQPTPILRVHEGTPEELLVFAARILTIHGGGLPAFFSDEAMIGALDKMGVEIREAREYGISGCSEAVIPGRSLSFTGGDCYFNFLKILEILLHEGINPRTGIRLFPAPKLEEYGSVDDLIEEYCRHLARYMELVVPLTAVTSSVDAGLNPTPFTSGLIDFRIEMGRDVSEGGGENTRCSQTILQGHGTANFANSMLAIEQLVFREKRMSLRRLAELLDGDFASEEGRNLRTALLNLPKYGNDLPEVDRFARLISDIFAAEAARYRPWRGGVFGVSLQGLTANVPEGETVGATPDGRKAGEALADNVSAHAGTDRLGPTATLKSVSAIDHTKFVNGNILNLRFHPSSLTDSFGEFDAGRSERFAHLIKTYLVDLRGSQVQFNLVSSGILREAQEKPREYRDLIVKVAGYSAYFSSLDRGLQDQIIERTEHAI